LIVVAMGSKLAPAAPMLRVLAWALPLSICSGHAYWTLAAAGAQKQLLLAQLAGLSAVVGVGLLLGPFADGLGYPFAALAGFAMVWVAAHVAAARRGLHPPPLHHVVKPALLALAVGTLVEALEAGPWLSLVGLVLYVALAPLVDRKLLRDLFGLGRSVDEAGAPAR